MTRSRTSFDRIALSLSGGGYRAAAFHLGTLTLLDRVGLLTSVRALSTASGGTIVAAYYAQCLARGIGFAAFRAEFRRFLVERDVIEDALVALEHQRDVRTSLITAAADAYAMLLTATLGEVIASRDHLEEISFNATDMTNGLAFRFVKTSSHLVRSGNRVTSIAPAVAQQLRLADITAASSCFPAAFEPMRFPDDFVLPRGTKEGVITTPLMDGGIYDNQGIDSLLLVRARRSREIDVILLSDADTSDPPLYIEPRTGPGSGIRVSTIYYALLALGGLSAGSFIAAATAWRSTWPQMLVLSTVSLLCALTIAKMRRLAATPIGGRARPLLWRHLMKLTVGDVMTAAASRGASLVSLTSKVFMKRVRALTYARVFERPSTRERAVGNLITDLADDESVSPPLREFAKRTAMMPTTLWADTPAQIDDLILLGQLTTCRNLLKRIETHGGDEELRGRLTQAWSELQPK